MGGFRITQLAPNVTNTTAPAAADPSPNTQSPLSGALAGVSTGYTTYQKVTIAFGSIFGALSFFILLFLCSLISHLLVTLVSVCLQLQLLPWIFASKSSRCRM